MLYDYVLVRSQRKTLTVNITQELIVEVRAPLHMPIEEINCFVEESTAWITKHLEIQRQNRAAYPEPSMEEQAELIRRAIEYIPPKVAYYAAIMGLHPTGVNITGARTRFGSCSRKNSLCFSWRLMQYPEAAIDCVIVHELAHIAHKNHGKDFYACIATIMPDYKERKVLLK